MTDPSGRFCLGVRAGTRHLQLVISTNALGVISPPPVHLRPGAASSANEQTLVHPHPAPTAQQKVLRTVENTKGFTLEKGDIEDSHCAPCSIAKATNFLIRAQFTPTVAAPCSTSLTLALLWVSIILQYRRGSSRSTLRRAPSIRLFATQALSC